MTTPYPGLTYPNPRTWSAGDDITTPRLRGDITNIEALMCAGRPMLVASNSVNASVPSGSVSLIAFSEITLNTWNVPGLIVGSPPTNPTYPVPFAGWYLLTGDCLLGGSLINPQQAKFAFGFSITQTTNTPVNTDGGAVPGTSVTGAFQNPGANGAELVQLNPGNSDSVAYYVFQNNGQSCFVQTCNQAAEWVALPSLGVPNYSGPLGTVVASPPGAAAFPSGPGTYLSGTIPVGAGTITVADTTGIITGGPLGLDWHMGVPQQPVAETVTVSGVPGGGTVTISATAYAHAQNAPVAVPVSAALMNRQVRDAINFLAFPPILRATAGTVQAIASSAVGAPVQITTLGTAPSTITGDFPRVDNFSGFASSVYVVPVSGVYFVYGQTYLAGSTSAFAAGCGIGVNGTVSWGTQFISQTTSGAQSLCPNVTTNLRVTAGSTISLWCYQGSGASMNTLATGATRSKLIAVFRNF